MTVSTTDQPITRQQHRQINQSHDSNTDRSTNHLTATPTDQPITRQQHRQINQSHDSINNRSTNNPTAPRTVC